MTASWPENSPDKLEEICVQYCAENPESFSSRDVETSQYKLHQGVTLPKSLCDKLLKSLISIDSQGFLSKFSIFSDATRTQISTLCLRDSLLTDEDLKCLENQPIMDLEIINCKGLTPDSLSTMKNFKKTLKCLKIDADSSSVLMREECCSDRNTNAQSDNVTEFPNLRALCVHELNDSDDLLRDVLPTMTQLTYLDLSNCALNTFDVKSFHYLPSLRSLNLSNVIKAQTKHLLNFIFSLKLLRHLDISVGDEDVIPMKYSDPDQTLSLLVNNLPQLVSLDISGTNLAGFDKIDTPISHKLEPKSRKSENSDEEETECCIQGLQGRHLEFLGLLDCAHEPCIRENIPAKKVTGHGNEEQVLLAMKVYQERPDMLCSAFNKIFNMFQSNIVNDQCNALEGLLDGMERHPTAKNVQISGCASLFYITKGVQKDNLTQKQKRRVINIILDGMEKFRTDRTMLRNGCLTLCYFNISQDVLYCYSRLSTVLLRMLQMESLDNFIHRIGIYLLNCLACQVNQKQKALVGDLGAIDTMLKIIQKKLEDKECDDLMEVAWSSMWNITDETATNCQRFIDGQGLDLFLSCLEVFQDRAELLRNMMGLMGNIAEVKELRPQLMVAKYISVFSDLLASTSDGIEVSYNAAGVLAHLASDGPQVWCIEEPCREEVLSRLTSAMQRWDIKSSRNINYRSFEPILQLLVHFDTPEVQHWAIWALCNLTSVYPEKYCKLLEDEKGPERLQKVYDDFNTSQPIKDLIEQILKNIQDFKERPTDEDMDSS